MIAPTAVEGLISEREGRKLAALAARVPEGQVIVEIGAARGLSTCWLAYGSHRGAGVPVWTFDPWDWDPGAADAFAENIAVTGADALIVAHRMRATDYDGPRPVVGLLFHDAGHSEEDIAADYAAWAPCFAGDAWFACHDFVGRSWNPETLAYEVTVPRVTHQNFFRRAILPGARWDQIEVVETLWVGHRVA